MTAEYFHVMLWICLLAAPVGALTCALTWWIVFSVALTEHADQDFEDLGRDACRKVWMTEDEVRKMIEDRERGEE